MANLGGTWREERGQASESSLLKYMPKKCQPTSPGESIHTRLRLSILIVSSGSESAAAASAGAAADREEHGHRRHEPVEFGKRTVSFHTKRHALEG
jgi:hypothetical protein